MNLKTQLSRAWVLSLLCAIGFGVMALLVSDHKIASFDDAIITFVQGLESPALTSVMKLFSYLGGGYPVVIVTLITLLVLYKVLHHRRELVLFIGVVAGSALLNQALKSLFQRERPTLYRIIEANGFSFPSGHSMAAFTMYGVLAFLLWRHIPTSLGRATLIVCSTAMITAIGLSRIYLGVHYPSDVFGGFLASGCWLAFSIWFFQRGQERRQSKETME